MMMIVLRLLSLLRLKSRWHRHFGRPRALNRVFFAGAGVGGFVDSWPKTLVPSASKRSTPVWTPVDSVDSGKGDREEELSRLSHHAALHHSTGARAGQLVVLHRLDARLEG